VDKPWYPFLSCAHKGISIVLINQALITAQRRVNIIESSCKMFSGTGTEKKKMFSGDRFQNQDPGHISIFKKRTRFTCTYGFNLHREVKKNTKVLCLFTKKSTENGVLGMISESYKHVGCCWQKCRRRMLHRSVRLVAATKKGSLPVSTKPWRLRLGRNNGKQKLGRHPPRPMVMQTNFGMHVKVCWRNLLSIN